MSSAVVIPLTDTNTGALRRTASDRLVPKLKKDIDSGSSLGKDAGSLRRAATANAARSATILPRKKLPWLDDPKDREASNQSHERGIQEPSPLDVLKSIGRSPLSNDTATAQPAPMQSPSNRDRPSPNVSPSRADLHDPDSTRLAYASSDYSAESSAEEPAPFTLPRQDPASYERLVMNPAIARNKPPSLHENDREPSRDNGQHSLPSSPLVTSSDHRRHHGTTKPKPLPGLHHQRHGDIPAPGPPGPPLRRCKSCDKQLNPQGTRAKSGSPSHHKRSSPRAGRPRRKSDADLRHRSVSLSRTVVGLENLMDDAARVGLANEVAGMLNDASLVLRQAGSLPSANNRALRGSPQASLQSSKSGKDGASSSTSSVSQGRIYSEILPTIITKGGRPRQKKSRRPKSENASDVGSLAHTPPRMYSAASADPVIRDFANTLGTRTRRHSDSSVGQPLSYGAAASFYGDQGQSVAAQPGVRKSIAGYDKLLPLPPPARLRNARQANGKHDRVLRAHQLQQDDGARGLPAPEHVGSVEQMQPTLQQVMDAPNHQSPARPSPDENPFSDSAAIRGAEADEEDDDDDTPPSSQINRSKTSKTHVSLQEGDTFNVDRFHKRRPIAREWNMGRKRLTAMIACLNTIFTGFIAGIYAGEVPRIQYQLADQSHWVIFGNTLLFAGMGLTTLIFWPLPLLHGRKPYVLVAFALMLPFHIPQALTISSSRDPSPLYRVGLLIPRALTGLALGFANINFLPTLWDLFGASLMSERPHQEIVMYNDVRRQGGGVGMWLGLWTFCFSSSLSIGFCVGACIISKLDPSWGFWIVIILLVFFLLVNVIAPETRKGVYRHSVHHFIDQSDPEKIRRRVAKGEVKLHISNDGPAWWGQEVWAGLILTKRMASQAGFFVMMLYLAWINAQLTLVILLLGALLSRDYEWQSQWVGIAALAVPVGALLAMPLAKASWLSRARTTPPRTDSMTMRAHVTRTSHFVRRVFFSLLLPFAGLGYCLTASGPPLHWSACIIFAGFVGFLTDLGITECIGLIMETFDTCDLQPGANTKHRRQSMSSSTRRRRTTYSSFPRVCAGFFAAQSLGFFLAAAATVVAGRVTDAHGAQYSMAIVAGILLGVTLLFFIAVTRWKNVRVIPSYTADAGRPSVEWHPIDPEWKPVIIGNPSGHMRRMNILEIGKWSRWSEIRRLNKLSKT